MKRIDVAVPVGKAGEWSVEELTITQEQASWSEVRAAVKGDPDLVVAAGSYKLLKCGNNIVMSNTQMEINSNLEFIERARGNVLINGLGLGMVLTAILDNPEVERVTVIEISEDVIALVAPTYQDHPKLTIINESAFQYEPPANEHYDVVWHDIWPEINPDNVDEMDTLIEKYRQRCDWQDAWKMRECEQMQAFSFMFASDF